MTKLPFIITSLLIISNLCIAISPFAQDSQSGVDIGHAIRLKSDSAKDIFFTRKTPVFFSLHYTTPVKVGIHIHTEDKSLQSSKLLVQIIRLVDAEPDTAVIKQEVIQANDSSFVFEALESVYIAVTSIESKRNIRLSVTLDKAQDVQAEPINIQKGNSYPFHFEKYTKTSFFSVHLMERSLLTFEVHSMLIDTIRSNGYHYYQRASMAMSKGKSGAFLLSKAEAGGHTMRFLFSADSGSYLLHIYLDEYGGLEKPLSTDTEKDPATLVIADVKPQRIPSEIKTFNDWLTESGISTYLSLVIFSDNIMQDTSVPKEIVSNMLQKRNYIGMLRSAYLIKDSLLRTRTIDSIEFGIPLSGKNYNRVDSSEFPVTFLYLAPKSDLEDFEPAFSKQNDITLWGKIFQKLRLTNDFLPAGIFIYVPVYCDADLVYLNKSEDEYTLRRRGSTCTSARYSVQLPITPANLNSHSNVSLNQKEFAFDKKDLDRLFRLSVFDSLFNNKNQKLTFFEVNHTYFELTTSGLKNVILKGHNYWEKITVRGFLREDGGKQSLDILVDGLFTTGIGSAPKNESQYDRNFEPKFISDLTDFAKICTQVFSEHIKN